MMFLHSVSSAVARLVEVLISVYRLKQGGRQQVRRERECDAPYLFWRLLFPGVVLILLAPTFLPLDLFSRGISSRKIYPGISPAMLVILAINH
jgi:hypothetical protein